MGMSLMDLDYSGLFRRTANKFEDFFNYTTAGLWTTGGTSAVVGCVAGGVGGILSIATGATSTNEAWAATTNQPVKFLANQPAIFETFMQFTDTGTNNGQFVVGLCSDFATGLITTGALTSSFSGAVFYKLTGQTTIHVATSIGTTIVTHDTGVVATNSAYVTLTVVCRPSQNAASNLMEVVYLINGKEPLDPTYYRPVKDYVTITSAAAMGAGWYLQTGSANAQTLLVDYGYFGQLRSPAPA